MSRFRLSDGIPMPGMFTTGLMIVAVGASWLLMSESKSASEKTQIDLADSNPVTRIQAVQELINRGSAGVSELANVVRDLDSKSRVLATIGLGHVGPPAIGAIDVVRNAMSDKNPQVRAAAVSSYWQITRVPTVTTQAIFPSLGDSAEEVRMSANAILESIARLDCMPLLELLRNDISEVHLAGWRILQKSRNDATGTIQSDTLRGLLSHSNPEIRKQALITILSWQMANVDEIHDLMRLESTTADGNGTPALDVFCIELCLRAICNLGPDAPQFFSEVVRLLDRLGKLESVSTLTLRSGPQKTIEVYRLNSQFELALQAMSSMKSAAISVAPKLMKQMEDLRPRNRVLVAKTLLDIGCQPDLIVPILLPLMSEAIKDYWVEFQGEIWYDYEIAFKAAGLLSQANPDVARQHVFQLMPRLMRNEGNINLIALHSLAGLGPVAKEAIPIVTPLLRNSDREVQSVAILILSGVGRDAESAVPALISRFHQPRSDIDDQIYERVLMALGKIGPSARSAVPEMLLMIRDPDSYVWEPRVPRFTRYRLSPSEQLKIMAVFTLGLIGERSNDTLTILRQLITETSGHARVAAIKALGEAGQQSDVVLGDILPYVQDEDESTRFQAVTSIGLLNGNRATAVPFLREALDDSSIRVRAAAVITLGQIGSDARSLLPLLKELRDAGTVVKLPDNRSRFAFARTRPWFDPTPEFETRSFAQILDVAISSIEPPAF